MSYKTVQTVNGVVFRLYPNRLQEMRPGWDYKRNETCLSPNRFATRADVQRVFRAAGSLKSEVIVCTYYATDKPNGPFVVYTAEYKSNPQLEFHIGCMYFRDEAVKIIKKWATEVQVRVKVREVKKPQRGSRSRAKAR